MLEKVREQRALIGGRRDELDSGFVPPRPDRLGPSNRGGAFKRRSIRILNSVLGQEEAHRDHVSNRERPREVDRGAAGAQILGFRMKGLTGDRELTRDADRVACVLSLRGRVGHPFMMRKKCGRRQIAALLRRVRSPRSGLRAHRFGFGRELAVVGLLIDQPRVDRQRALEMPLFSEDARHGPGGEGLLEKPGPAGEDPGGRAARRPVGPGLRRCRGRWRWR